MSPEANRPAEGEAPPVEAPPVEAPPVKAKPKLTTLKHRPGMSRSRALPGPKTTALSIKSKSRCGARGLRMFGFHFKCDKAIVIKLSEIEWDVARRLCAHGELDIIEIDKSDQVLTPKRKVPPKPISKAEKARAAAKPTAGKEAKRMRGIPEEPPPKSNHPRPAEPVPETARPMQPTKAEKAKRRRGGADD